jgi:glycosyltransferase involved in cell wall biosynthesis
MSASKHNSVNAGSEHIELSIVIPIFNEAENLDGLFDRLLPVLQKCTPTYEIVCVDDGSIDETFDRLRALSRRIPQLRAVGLSRNFGKEIAVMAGLARASGRAVVIMDADLQHPPESIPALLDMWRKGFKIVLTRREQLHEGSGLRRIFTAGFFRFFNAFSEITLDPEIGEFLLLDRRIVKTVLSLPERHRFNRGLIAWIGFRRAVVPVKIDPRKFGQTQFNLARLLRHAVYAIVSFGSFPLHVWSYVGLIVSAFALSYGAYIVVETLIYGSDVPGYPTIIVAILGLSGLQLIGLGVIGEYLGKVFAEVKRRPLYIVADEVGFRDTPASMESAVVSEIPMKPVASETLVQKEMANPKDRTS